MRYFLFLLLLLSSLCIAALYQQTDQNSNTVYSDTPLTDNAQSIPAPSSSTAVSTSPVSPTVSTTAVPVPVASDDTTRKPYKTFVIESPKDQESIQNQPTIPVEIKLEPALQKGDKIQLFLDGKAVGSGVESIHLSLSFVERGTHQLSAVLTDIQNNQIRTKTITIFVHRQHINQTQSTTTTVQTFFDGIVQYANDALKNTSN